MKCVVTHTDTFGGEANYGWVNRYEFTEQQLEIALRSLNARGSV